MLQILKLLNQVSVRFLVNHGNIATIIQTKNIQIIEKVFIKYSFLCLKYVSTSNPDQVKKEIIENVFIRKILSFG